MQLNYETFKNNIWGASGYLARGAMGVIFFLPIIIYSVTILRFSINIPHYDDYPLLLGFMNNYHDVHSINEFLSLLFSQTAEYKIAFAKMIALGDYLINNNLNFVRLTIVGNAALLLTFYLLYKSSVIEKKYKLMALLPIPYLYFQIQYWESSTWSIVALNHFYVFCFSLLCIYLLNMQTKITFLLALLVSVITPFTSTNGLFVYAIGFIFLVIQHNYKFAFVWLLSSALMIFSYFLNFETAQVPINHVASDRILSLSLIKYFFGLIGSSAGFGLEYPSIIAGIIIASWFCYLHYKKYYRVNPVIYFFTIFLIISSIAITISRNGYGIDIFLYTSRYRLVSTLIIVCAVIAYLEYFGNFHATAKIPIMIFAGSVGFMLFSYLLYLPFLSGRYEELKSGINGLSNSNHSNAYQTIVNSAKNGIYHLPNGYIDKIRPDYRRSAEAKIKNFIDRFNGEHSSDTVLTLRINIDRHSPFDSAFHVLLQKPEVIYLFNSGLTPTTIREVLHPDANPDLLKSELIIKKKE
ncbi:MAG: hypothetical protein NTV58_17190 [Deltaproteobacteria bacterium]|nr:hypothetical protein [Deltaproteobacteria bacterium]